MSRAAATRRSDVGPLPVPGQSVWLEDLPSGPAEVFVEEAIGPLVRTDTPRLGGKELPVHIGARMRVGFTDQEIPCTAVTTVIKPPRGRKPGPWLEVHEVRRTQRRGAVRVPALLMGRVTSEDPQMDMAIATVDLSSTGVLVRSETSCPLDAVVQLTIHLGGIHGDIEADASVVRSMRVDRSDRPWQVAFRFINIKTEIEDRIVRFVFERQREIRSRETGRR